MPDDPRYEMTIRVESTYVPEQSLPERNRYVFAYTITIENTGNIAAKLLKRHWFITDANNKIQEVHGEGVVGEQPYLPPGKRYRYTSAAVLETPLGCMQGSYDLIADDGVLFEAPIPLFRLASSVTLH
ncbi:MAG: Co2+/Mg2+ efflux protein ApaG [Gammaproteobacteria bacterium]|jgi:ApaG protein